MGEQLDIFALVATVPAQPTQAPLAADHGAEGSGGKVDAVEAPSRGSTGHVEADDATADKRIVARSMTPAARRRGGWS